MFCDDTCQTLINKTAADLDILIQSIGNISLATGLYLPLSCTPLNSRYQATLNVTCNDFFNVAVELFQLFMAFAVIMTLAELLRRCIPAKNDSLFTPTTGSGWHDEEPTWGSSPPPPRPSKELGAPPPYVPIREQQF